MHCNVTKCTVGYSKNRPTYSMKKLCVMTHLEAGGQINIWLECCYYRHMVWMSRSVSPDSAYQTLCSMVSVYDWKLSLWSRGRTSETLVSGILLLCRLYRCVMLI